MTGIEKVPKHMRAYVRQRGGKEQVRESVSREFREEKWDADRIAVSNGPLGGFSSPAISTVVIEHAPVPPEVEGDGYAACKALGETYFERGKAGVKMLQLQCYRF